MAARPKSRVVRQSWATYDALVERAFAEDDVPSPTVSPESAVHPLEPDAVSDNALGPLWEKVWELKAKALETLPSKVKSLDVGKRRASQNERGGKVGIVEISPKNSESPDRTKVETPRGEKPHKLKRKSRYSSNIMKGI